MWTGGAADLLIKEVWRWLHGETYYDRARSSPARSCCRWAVTRRAHIHCWIPCRGVEFLRGGPLINLERAYQVIAEEGFDSLIVTRPTNFCHLTGYYDHVAIRHDAPNSFALLARDERQTLSVVMNQFLYYYITTASPTAGSIA